MPEIVVAKADVVVGDVVRAAVGEGEGEEVDGPCVVSD